MHTHFLSGDLWFWIFGTAPLSKFIRLASHHCRAFRATNDQKTELPKGSYLERRLLPRIANQVDYPLQTVRNLCLPGDHPSPRSSHLPSLPGIQEKHKRN